MKTGKLFTAPRIIIAIAAILVGIVVIGAFLLTAQKADCGTDKACFLFRAAQCKEAKLVISDYRGSALLLENNCTITKRLTTLTNATSRTSDFLVGYDMACPHKKGEVPDVLLTSITSGTSYCDGELADRLFELTAYS